MPIPHLIINLLIVAALGGLGFALRKRRATAIAGLVGAIVLALLGVGAILRPDLLVMVLPVKGAIFYTNWFTPAAALFIGCVFHFAKDRGHAIRMGVLAAILFVISLQEYIHFYQPPATSYQTWIDDDGICRQSSLDTCSAAALVTMTRLYGVEITEDQAIALAMTKEKVGTTHLGLYHGLKILFAEREDIRVQLRKLPLEDVLSRGEAAIITVGLPRYDNEAEALAFGEKYDWRPGVLHDVVFLGMDPDREGYVHIGEPDFGLESWPLEHLEYLYYGFAVYLEER